MIFSWNTLTLLLRFSSSYENYHLLLVKIKEESPEDLPYWRAHRRQAECRLRYVETHQATRAARKQNCTRTTSTYRTTT